MRLPRTNESLTPGGAARLEVRVLGPLELIVDGGLVALPGARQRALLAILALNANTVVSADRLVDELWGGEPPTSGPTALQVAISRLRKALGPAGGRLETRPPGYVLRLRPDELDVDAFTRLVDEGRELEPARGAELLRDALALWRGDVLSDHAAEPFARVAAARLEELRLAALERRFELELELGWHAEFVGELSALIVAHPLRERPRALLMLALYRSGRQAEALELYQSSRRILDEELGLEPGPTLRDLERAILRQDRALDFATSAAPERRIVVAVQAESQIEPLLALAGGLARRPPKEIVIASALDSARDLSERARVLNEHREGLRARGLAARAAAFVSAAPADDLLRLVVNHDADLLLVACAPDGLLDDPIVGAVLAAVPCDVAVLIGGDVRAGPVLVPFAGAAHDWAAVELGAWLAGATEEPLILAGTFAQPDSGRRDASHLLASASLAVQRALGIAAEPLLVEPGATAIVQAAEAAGCVVVGLSDRWPRDGLGTVRHALAIAGGPPTVLVRRGVRPGGIAPDHSLSRYTWSLGSVGST